MLATHAVPRAAHRMSADTPDDDAPIPEHDAAAVLAPAAYAHWRDTIASPLSGNVTEFALYTDVQIVGEIPAFGPYRVLNAIAALAEGTDVPAMYLRVSWTAGEYRPPDMRATRADHYHGGTLVDEVAALLSLEGGLRVFAARYASREFRAGDDPLGRPLHFGLDRPPAQHKPGGRGVVVPAAGGQRNISELPLLTRLAEMRAGDAVALVKAARLFQDALWLVETAPQLAWLLLVSAVETAATHQAREGTAVERLEAWNANLAGQLREAGGDALLRRVAEMVAPLTGATGKFVTFLLDFAPELPEPRPPEWARAPLASRKQRKELYGTVYKYRSDALHAGKPFPGPMCETPHHFGTEDAGPYRGAYAERPTGFAAAHGTAVWRAVDTPVLLNTFVVLARGALLAWWQSMLPFDQTPPDAQP